MHRVALLRIAIACGLIVLIVGAVASAQIVPPDYEDSKESPKKIQIKLDKSSENLAEEYLDILEQLQEIVEDYSEYLSELEPAICEGYSISFGVFTEGLQSGRYAKSYKELLSDIEDFVQNLRHLEREHQDASGTADQRCRRIIRNLRREMNMLVDLTEEHVDHAKAKEIWNENLQLYLEEGLKHLIIMLEDRQDELDEIIGRAAEIPLLPPIPDIKPLPAIPIPHKKGVSDYNHAKGEVGLVRDFSDSLTVKRSDHTIHISNPLGDVKIIGWDKGVIVSTLEIEVKAEPHVVEKDFVSESSLKMAMSGNSYEVQADLPKVSDPSIKILTSTLTVYVPYGNPVECENAFGELFVSDLGNGADVTGQYSKIKVENVQGNITVANTMGPIALEDITGSISVRNGYSPIEIIACDGDMTIENAYSEITLDNSRGQVILSNSGRITVHSHTGNVTITNTYGTVEVNRLDGDLRATNAFQPLVIRNIKGEAELENTYAKINASDISDFLSATNKYGQIFGEKLNGPLKVFSENGTIKLVLDRQLNGPSTVTASYGTIDLTLNESTNIFLKAHTINGDIQTLLPLLIRDEGTTMSTEYKFGKGRNTLAVSGRNTSIIISSTK